MKILVSGYDRNGALQAPYFACSDTEENFDIA